MEGGGLHIPQTELVYAFGQDGRLGIINLHIIILFLVGICIEKRERERGMGWGKKEGISVEQSTFLFTPQNKF